MNLTRDEVLARLADDMHTLFEIPRESVVPQARLYDRTLTVTCSKWG
jgi:hypothetical protein